MKAQTALFAASIVALTLATITIPVSRFAVWNVSASVPTGLYLIRGKRSIHVGERVAIEPPLGLRRLLAERGYLPVGVPLLKRVAAVSGQRVCRFAHGVTIDGQLVGIARAPLRLTASTDAILACSQRIQSSVAQRLSGPTKPAMAIMSGSHCRHFQHPTPNRRKTNHDSNWQLYRNRRRLRRSHPYGEPRRNRLAHPR
jgi:type IV secretory pathway protease TraF